MNDDLTAAQRTMAEKDLGLPGTWWAIMSKPRSFFVRAGVQAGNYGDELLFASGATPNPLIFYFSLQIVAVVLEILISGSVLAGAGILFMRVVGVLGMILGFYVMAGTCHVVAKLVQCQGDFESAKSVVAFSSAPIVLLGVTRILPGMPALVIFLYWVVLLYFSLRHIYRVSLAKALVLLLIIGGLVTAAGVMFVFYKSVTGA